MNDSPAEYLAEQARWLAERSNPLTPTATHDLGSGWHMDRFDDGSMVIRNPGKEQAFDLSRFEVRRLREIMNADNGDFWQPT